MSVQQGDYIEGVGTAGNPVGGVVSVQQIAGSAYNILAANIPTSGTPGTTATTALTAPSGVGFRYRVFMLYVSIGAVSVLNSTGYVYFYCSDNNGGTNSYFSGSALSVDNPNLLLDFRPNGILFPDNGQLWIITAATAASQNLGMTMYYQYN